MTLAPPGMKQQPAHHHQHMELVELLALVECCSAWRRGALTSTTQPGPTQTSLATQHSTVHQAPSSCCNL
jgi:hypothetical protein